VTTVQSIAAVPLLQPELAATAQQLAAALPAEANATINDGIASVAASGVAAQSLGVGDQAPDFTLPNAAGGTTTLSELLAEGPVVLTFYRGGWCPYCNVQLRGYQRALPAFGAHAATLVAVSPQTPDQSLSTAEQKELNYPVLSDVGNAVARRYGLVYSVGDAVYTTLAGVGIDLAAFNGDRSGELPLTATFVIARNGVIAWADVGADFKQRPEPSDIVAALAALPRA
jgi:peroxiredoxin